MANNMTDYLEKKLLDHCLGVASFTMPTTIYVGLFTADPTETGAAATEITGNAYVRKAMAFNAATLGAGNTANSVDVVWPQATGSWGTVSHVVLFDALSGGNPLFYGPLTTPQAVANTNTFQIKAGQSTISLG